MSTLRHTLSEWNACWRTLLVSVNTWHSMWSVYNDIKILKSVQKHRFLFFTHMYNMFVLYKLIWIFFTINILVYLRDLIKWTNTLFIIASSQDNWTFVCASAIQSTIVKILWLLYLDLNSHNKGIQHFITLINKHFLCLFVRKM